MHEPQHGFENPAVKYSTKTVSDREYKSTSIPDFTERTPKI